MIATLTTLSLSQVLARLCLSEAQAWPSFPFAASSDSTSSRSH